VASGAVAPVTFGAEPLRKRSHLVSVFELRDGSIARLTEYFADPFGAPEWRLQLLDVR